VPPDTGAPTPGAGPVSAGRVRYEDLIGLWQEGQRRLDRAEPADRTAMERAAEAIVAELRRRLGGPFTVQELAQLYVDQGTDWCFDIAVRVAPSRPAAWDMPTVAGSAFARYAREAIDYTTGRRTAEP
jgi:hypothetical protein